MITNERRAYKRVKLEFHVKYRSLSSGKNISGNSCTRNICCGGIYFEVFSSFAIGELLDCRIGVPGDAGQLRFSSRVVRCEPLSSAMASTFGIAVEFVKPYGRSDEELRLILSKS